ncbi:substrate-binding domain-containing protein [Kocuria sp. CPCC 205233]|uniref:substrate-binding domain-containing protein n=1 Tax=Kocuria TaxID=57493 RepID=UPI0034D51F16
MVLYNDLMAMGFAHELQKHRVRIPQDVAVVGFDNVQELELMPLRCHPWPRPCTRWGARRSPISWP